ncbi:MAG: hypothetical protein EBU90_31395, partial [Proteobacteria bacterium]|nr:hypothetical protein [Pseudomonadota bacterium]
TLATTNGGDGASDEGKVPTLGSSGGLHVSNTVTVASVSGGPAGLVLGQGSNTVLITAPSSLSGNYMLTLPNKSGTVATTSDSIALSQLAQTGASTGQVLKWTGSTWAPGTVTGGGGIDTGSSTAILKGNGSGGFADAAAGTDYVSPSGLTSALASYVTSSTLTSTLASYVTSSTLTSTLASYVTSSSLTSTLASYVTSSGLASTLASYATLGTTETFTRGKSIVTNTLNETPLVLRNSNASSTAYLFEALDPAGARVAAIQVDGAFLANSAEIGGVTLENGILQAGTASLEGTLVLNPQTSPITTTAGSVAFKQNALATGRGALQVHDGTGTAYLVQIPTGTTLTTGHVVTYQGSGVFGL